MNYMTGSELRKKFLEFFASKDHLILPSYPLIPEDDPTLLLIGAGMAPFKPFFTGKMKPPRVRISTSQKCVRTGDIENVGRTARHHTFFEMLGNFSFGDYFKKEAIAWAWEFLTEHIYLPKDKLWVTIHPKDEEAFEIWKNDIGLPAERIIRLEDNFWEIGPGPCGPCSEIYIDLGEARGCGNEDCGVGCNCDRFLEIWNLVFTQYDRDEAGNYTPLAKKNIDTGAGLERIASVLQNKKSNFETDLLFPIIEHTAKVAGVTYGQSAKTDISLKVIADHGRSMAVMIGDGILPSNEGRGYVLRRILRRAVRHGRLMGIEKTFLVDIVDVVAAIFAEAYPDITDKKEYIKKVIRQEEERFQTTLAQGMELLNGHIADMVKKGNKTLDGTIAFQLYDTFGFPWELTLEILLEHDLELDKVGFDQAMGIQRERARAARQDNEDKIVLPDLSRLSGEKLSHDFSATNAKVVLLWEDGNLIEAAHDDEEIGVILSVTPFYAEGGGQIGDTGVLTGPMGKVQIATAKKLPDGTIYHWGQVIEGSLKTGDIVAVEVDETRRGSTARNHTATHLLQAALRSVLGEHVNQAGSMVTPERLRFDFTHFAPVTQEQLTEIEKIVNRQILKNSQVQKQEMPQEEAKRLGATALFGEKYGDIVRVVLVDDFSKELCGGVHVSNTGEIGVFKIVAEAGIGSGVRRIEAVTGFGALEYIKERENTLQQAAHALKTRPEELLNRIDSLQGGIKELEQELAAIKTKLAKGDVEELLSRVETIQGIKVAVGVVAANDMDALRSIADMVRDRLVSGVVGIGAVNHDKVNFVVMATKDVVAKGVHAGNIVKEAAKVAGGGGGGRPDMAQAGAKQADKIGESLETMKNVIRQQIK
ncbi:alanine--tRNA ligase [Propionispora hippei]|uniref:Alanine--tRNA ligase n=1 Tax=Propionispora hippei DSM 15287 TaxID=1123003 RepID=A0A1M6NHM9_9FIRM|nr:alanine--tRNA ligase [Propionispora hippei]SHJ95199.1 alanyl-tRNA synthetase [Propionispora hippei DSM 15287]